jgi:hypothetical protein
MRPDTPILIVAGYGDAAPMLGMVMQKVLHTVSTAPDETGHHHEAPIGTCFRHRVPP